MFILAKVMMKHFSSRSAYISLICFSRHKGFIPVLFIMGLFPSQIIYCAIIQKPSFTCVEFHFNLCFKTVTVII